MIEFALAIYIGFGLMLGILLIILNFLVLVSTKEMKEVKMVQRNERNIHI